MKKIFNYFLHLINYFLDFFNNFNVVLWEILKKYFNIFLIKKHFKQYIYTTSLNTHSIYVLVGTLSSESSHSFEIWSGGSIWDMADPGWNRVGFKNKYGKSQLGVTWWSSWPSQKLSCNTFIIFYFLLKWCHYDL